MDSSTSTEEKRLENRVAVGRELSASTGERVEIQSQEEMRKQHSDGGGLESWFSKRSCKSSRSILGRGFPNRVMGFDASAVPSRH